MSGELIVTLVFAFLAFIILKKTAVVVPQQSAYVVERLGKYSSTLSASSRLGPEYTCLGRMPSFAYRSFMENISSGFMVC